jgi:hypothetical protein
MGADHFRLHFSDSIFLTQFAGRLKRRMILALRKLAGWSRPGKTVSIWGAAETNSQSDGSSLSSLTDDQRKLPELLS